MKKKIFWLAAFFIVSSAPIAMAGWKEDQAAMFEQISVKAGDKIDSSNWEKVKDILPPSVVNWVKKGDFILEIGELNWDFNTDVAWRKKTANNAGKYEIGSEGQLIENATGTYPEFVDGEPFPNVDWKRDPKAGDKLVRNVDTKSSRTGQLSLEFSVEWVGRNGRERTMRGVFRPYQYWVRPGGKVPNPFKFLNTALIQIVEPYDVSGIISLNQRYIDDRPDQVYSYVPAIRRVKKLAGTTRSSPFLGSDFCNDDSYMWDGKTESMNWKIVGKKIILVPFHVWAVEGPAKLGKQADGSWKKPQDLKPTISGYDVKGWEGAPWAPTNLRWVPRTLYIVEARAKDPYYNFGPTTFYIDPVEGFVYKVINNKSDEYWKTGMSTYMPAEWNNKITVSSSAWQLMVDDRSDHASVNHNNGPDIDQIYMDSSLTPAMYSPTALSVLSK